MLTINGHPATLPADASFKLVSENPYFAKGGEYTFEITLPLAGSPENQRIFGPAHRLEMQLDSFATLEFPFQLRAWPLLVEGKAIVTAITEADIKIKLTAGASAIRNPRHTDGTEMTIDQLQLGKVYEYLTLQYITNHFGQGLAELLNFDSNDQLHTTHDLKMLLANIMTTAGDTTRQKAQRIAHGRWTDTSAVVFPLYSLPSELLLNRHEQKRWENWEYVLADPRNYTYAVAPQPYLFHAFDRVLRAVGVSLDWDSIAQGWEADLFFLNAKPTLDLAEMLPAWTVAEFVREIELLLGAIMVVERGKARFVSYSSYYAGAKTVTLSQIVDEYQTEIDHDEPESRIGVTQNNLDYDWPTIHPAIRLPDEVWSNAKVKDFPNLGYIRQAWNALTDEQRRQSDTLYTWSANGQTYVYASLLNPISNQMVLSQLDTMPPLIRTSRKNNYTKLRIVPAAIGAVGMPGIKVDPATKKISETTIYDPQLAINEKAQADAAYSINAAVNAESKEKQAERERKSVLEVAYWDGTSYWNSSSGKSHFPPQPYGLVWEFDMDTPSSQGLRQLPISNTKQLFNLAVPSGIGANQRIPLRAKTGIVRQISFADPVMLQMNDIVFIRGRKYAILKVEYHIDAQGLNPVKVGHFYEVE